MRAQTETVHFNKKFGLITSDQLLLTSGNEKNRIQLESIERVYLVKYRVLYTNIFLFFFSCALLLFPTFVLQIEYKKIIPFAALSLLLLVYSYFHKFYFYRLEIKDVNKTTYTVKTSQLNRKCIKNFYFSLAKKVKKQLKNQ